MDHTKVNADLILLGDIEPEAEWIDGLLVLGLGEGVRLILDADAVDRLAAVVERFRRPRAVTPLRAIAGGAR